MNILLVMNVYMHFPLSKCHVFFMSGQFGHILFTVFLAVLTTERNIKKMAVAGENHEKGWKKTFMKEHTTNSFIACL